MGILIFIQHNYILTGSVIFLYLIVSSSSLPCYMDAKPVGVYAYLQFLWGTHSFYGFTHTPTLMSKVFMGVGMGSGKKT